MVIARNVIIALIFIGSLIAQMFICLDSELRYDDYSHPANNKDFFTVYYIKPWSRITPYILGLYFCELFLETPLYLKEKGKEDENDMHIFQKINLFFINNNIACVILFIFSLILINISVFCAYFTNYYDIPIIYHAYMLTFTKILFVFGLGCIVHLTFLGKFKFIYNILTLNIFTIVSRITYGIYLLHMFIILLVLTSLSNLLYMSFLELSIIAAGVFTIAIFVSFFFSLLIESPIINLTKKLLGDKKE
jgi:peptidoglycan/LPS O-acetylase OafA/YrhL